MGFYRSVGRPIFFSLPPEASHRLVSRLLQLPLPWPGLGSVVDSPTLETNLAGLDLRNPVGMAAGFDKECRLFRSLGKLGFGYVVCGTISRAPRKGNPGTRIIRRPAQRAIVNAMGIPNPGVEAVARRLAGARKTAPVLASLADEEVEDVVYCRDLLQPFVDGFEFNISSPNSPWRHDRSDNVDYLRRALSALAGSGGPPLFVKLPPSRTSGERDEVLDLARIARDAGVDGLTCSNTLPVEEARLTSGRGGLSGPELLEGTLRAVEEIKRETGVLVNASGGIWTATDARRCLDAGATTVQVYTALIYEGPRLLRAITSGLASPLATSGRGVED